MRRSAPATARNEPCRRVTPAWQRSAEPPGCIENTVKPPEIDCRLIDGNAAVRGGQALVKMSGAEPVKRGLSFSAASFGCRSPSRRLGQHHRRSPIRAEKRPQEGNTGPVSSDAAGPLSQSDRAQLEGGAGNEETAQRLSPVPRTRPKPHQASRQLATFPSRKPLLVDLDAEIRPGNRPK